MTPETLRTRTMATNLFEEAYLDMLNSIDSEGYPTTKRFPQDCETAKAVLADILYGALDNA